MSNTEITKMKQGMSYSCKEKTIILNVFKYFRSEFADKCVTEIVRCTSKATGCSEKSIFQFRKEEASAEGLKVPSTTKIRRNININSRDIKYDDHVRQTIRNIIYNLKYKNIVPSLNTILKEINNTTDIPKFSLMTLRRLMCDMGFSYEKSGNKSVLVEKPVVKKEKTLKKGKVKRKNNHRQQENNEQVTKPVTAAIHHTNQIPPSKVYCKFEEANNRVVPMHLTHHQPQLGPAMINIPPSTNMSMVLNHRIPPAPPPLTTHPNFNLHFKRELPPWIEHPTHHHHHNMMITKQ